MARQLIFEGDLEFHLDPEGGNIDIIVGTDNMTQVLARHVRADLTDGDVTDQTDADAFGEVRITVEFL